MRESFKEIGSDDRHVFTGTFARTGAKGRSHLTVLIQDIRDEAGNLLTDHAWFNYTQGFQALSLEEGDVVRFHARVAEYKKGYWGNNPQKKAKLAPPTIDYKLSYPTMIEKTGSKAEVRHVDPTRGKAGQRAKGRRNDAAMREALGMAPKQKRTVRARWE